MGSDPIPVALTQASMPPMDRKQALGERVDWASLCLQDWYSRGVLLQEVGDGSKIIFHGLSKHGRRKRGILPALVPAAAKAQDLVQLAPSLSSVWGTEATPLQNARIDGNSATACNPTVTARTTVAFNPLSPHVARREANRIETGQILLFES
jgi:hypothetical protein